MHDAKAKYDRVNQKEIAKNIYELVLQGTLVQQMNEPGQFVHIKVAEGIAPSAPPN